MSPSTSLSAENALAVAAVASILILWRRSHLAHEARHHAHVAVAVASEAAAAVRDASQLAEIKGLHAAAVDAAAEISRIRAGLDALTRSQSHDLWIPIPELPVAITANEGWSRCTRGLAFAQAGYTSSKKRRCTAHKKLLISRFDRARGGGEEKAYIDSLLAKHVARVWPDLAATLAASPHLVLLLLEAPSCATTSALVAAIPGLRAHGSRICIPQADPSHYAEMIKARESSDGVAAARERSEGAETEETRGGGAQKPDSAGAGGGPPRWSRCPVAAVACGAGLPVGEDEGAARSMLLNVRCQRLDQWLIQNASKGLRVPLFFADFETSVYGKPSCQFSPLGDLQRFLRSGFASSPCLLCVTLSYRTPNEAFYSAEAPQLSSEDVEGFVAAEAAAQGMECTPLETVKYGMTWSLFQLTRTADEELAAVS